MENLQTILQRFNKFWHPCAINITLYAPERSAKTARDHVDHESSPTAIVDHVVFTFAYTHTHACIKAIAVRRCRLMLDVRERMLAEQVNLRDSSNQSAIAVYSHSARFTGNVPRKVDYTQPYDFRTDGA